MGAKAPAKRDVDLFEKLLFCDTFRGPHSTGVFSRRKNLISGREDQVSYPMSKLAVTGPEYLQTGTWLKQRAGSTSYQKLANFYVGHNRYATVGAINATNAHPFRHGKITMVHNGTLQDQSLLPDSDDFVVDSDNVCYSLDKWGVDKTIQNLDGAFTLVWHNRETETLHVIRNEERPFHFAETSAGDWFGASEEDMLLWILERGKSRVVIKRHFEAAVGVEYIFDVKDDFKLKEERKHELPDFLTAYQSAWSNRARMAGYVPTKRGSAGSLADNGPVLQRTPVKQKKYQGVHETLLKFGVTQKVNDYIHFFPYSFESYGASRYKKDGKILGYIQTDDDYIDIVSHGVKEGTFDLEKTGVITLWGKIVGAYEQKDTLTIVLSDLTETEPTKCLPAPLVVEDVEDAVIVESVPFTTDGGQVIDMRTGEDITPYGEMTIDAGGEEVQELEGTTFTEQEWKDHHSTDCGNCSDPIEWHDVENCSTYLGSIICPGCTSEIFEMERKEELSGGTFECNGCATTQPVEQEHPQYHHTCKDCVTHFTKDDVPVKQDKVQVDRKTLSNGMSITQALWEIMNRCKCGETLHWEAADHYEMMGGVCLCENCSKKLDEKEGK